MNPFSRSLLMLGISGGVFAQDPAIPQMETAPAVTGIFGPIADGTPSPPSPEKSPIPFHVLNSTTKRMEVTESPEQPGLPDPQGTINFMTQLVADPGLPPVAKPLSPQVDLDDPAVQQQIHEAREKFRETKILFVSASVYGGTKTLLKVYPEGVGQREVSVISNLQQLLRVLDLPGKGHRSQWRRGNPPVCENHGTGELGFAGALANRRGPRVERVCSRRQIVDFVKNGAPTCNR